MVAWVWATHQSSGTGGTTCAASSFLTSRLPTWGPLPWVSTTSTPVATTSAMCAAPRGWRPAGRRGVADPSGPVMALPPRAITTRRDVIGGDPSGRFLSGEVHRSGGSPAPEVERGRGRAGSRPPRRRRRRGRTAAPPRPAAWASLPKLTASPPSSWNQRTWSTEASGLVVLTSRARPVAASARNTARYSSSYVLLHVPVRAAGPVAAREVDVGEHLEDVAALDHRRPSRRGTGASSPSASAQSSRPTPTSRPSRSSECSEPRMRSTGESRRCAATLAGEQVRLAGLDPGQDAQPGEPVAAPPQLGEVAVDVDRQLVRGCRSIRPSAVAASSHARR